MKKELLEKDGVSVKEEVDDDFFNDLIGDEEKPEEVDDEFNGLVGEEEEKPAEEQKEDKPEEEEKPTEQKKQKEEDEKEEAVFTKHEMALVAKHRTTLPLLIP